MNIVGTLRFKVVVVGDGSVGKTTLILRYTEKRFRESYIPTIGVQWVVKQLEYKENMVYFTLWDVAGQDQFKVMRGSFYEGSDAVIIVYDVTNLISFDHIENWLNEVKQFCENVPFVILGNKLDLKNDRKVTHEMIDSLKQRINLPYFETSAKTGENVMDMFNEVVTKILSHERPILKTLEIEEKENVNLNDELVILQELAKNGEPIQVINKELKMITNELFKQNPYHEKLEEMTKWRLEKLNRYEQEAQLTVSDKENLIEKIEDWKKSLFLEQ